MKRLLVLIGTSSLALAACGDDDSADNAASADVGAGAAPAVTVVQVEGLGQVLADADGMVLYMNDQDTADGVLCDDACVEEWPPLISESDTPAAAEGVTGLGVTDRPDGTSQVTFNGHPLYTFVDDTSPAQAGGDGDADEFDGQQFTWHAATVAAAGASGATTAPGGTQQSSTATTSGTGY